MSNWINDWATWPPRYQESQMQEKHLGLWEIQESPEGGTEAGAIELSKNVEA